jgi:hypothetical protein
MMTDFHYTDCKAAKNPVLTPEMVTDIESCDFVADPFWIKDKDGIDHLFFETGIQDRGEDGEYYIGHATSQNGLNWKYNGTVIDEQYSLSYPSLFQYEGKWYMIPTVGCNVTSNSALRSQNITNNHTPIYAATNFPDQWEEVATVPYLHQLRDATPICTDEGWFILAHDVSSPQRIRIYIAEDLFGDWREHPESPAMPSRPAGPVISFEDRIFLPLRPNQSPTRVILREIDTITKDRFKISSIIHETGIGPKYILSGKQSWNSMHMHHFCPAITSEGVDLDRAAVDGKAQNSDWRIGIFEPSNSIINKNVYMMHYIIFEKLYSIVPKIPISLSKYS